MINYSEICEGRNCEKRDVCKRYIDNHHKYYDTEYASQLIDWSNYGSCDFVKDNNGNHYLKHTWDCGDRSKTYPLFEQIDN